MTDRTAPLETLLDDVDAVSFDGLELERTGSGFRAVTPVTDPAPYTGDALRELVASAADPDASGVASDSDIDAEAAVAAHLTNWAYWRGTVAGEGTARRAFLRWCERAPVRASETNQPDDEAPTDSVLGRYTALASGIEREWGELLLTARFDPAGAPGERGYEVRHVDDRNTDPTDLEAFADPTAARVIATEDAAGRYRPLSTAPTLVDGWRFGGLGPDELVETVEWFYPATVANWHRERRDALDVSQWSETAERQTGIYDVVDELPREAVEWMAEACCADSQCLKRREWDYDEDDELAVDGGDGPFPCREPCSLVISAARKWAILESEAEKQVSLELTTSELNQLSELIDVVADGRTADVREADLNEGANRFRARYLRAKRFEDGALSTRAPDE